MFLDVPHTTIDDSTQTSKFLRPGRHQAAPARGRKSLRLLDVHDVARFIRVREVNRRRRAGTLGLDHLHCNCRSVDAGSASRREHLETVQEAAVRVLELDERIANLVSFVNDWLELQGHVAYVAGGEPFQALQGLGDAHCGWLRDEEGWSGSFKLELKLDGSTPIPTRPTSGTLK